MVVYTERVEMVSPGRRSVLVLATAGLIAYVAWKLQEAPSIQKAGELLLKNLHFLMGAAGLSTLAMTNEMTIELGYDALVLRTGITARRIPLKEISSATAVTELEQSEWWIFRFGGHGSTVSELVRMGVRANLFGGNTVEFSSNNPDHLASMINDLARQELLQKPREPEEKTFSRFFRRWFS